MTQYCKAKATVFMTWRSGEVEKAHVLCGKFLHDGAHASRIGASSLRAQWTGEHAIVHVDETPRALSQDSVAGA